MGGLHLDWEKSSHDTELSAYQLLLRLQGQYIPRLYGVVRLHTTSESTPLHPITDIVEGLALEYIPGVSMEKLKPGIDVSEEAENCLLHNDVHTRNIVLREGNQTLVIIDFGLGILNMAMRNGSALSTEVRIHAT